MIPLHIFAMAVMAALAPLPSLGQPAMATPPSLPLPPDPMDQIQGIWSIAQGPAKARRWVIIHQRSERAGEAFYHIEVISRPAGAPAWQISRLAPHMAISEGALRRSIIKPLDRGGVYPEAFHDARAKWQAEQGGAGGAICTTSVVKCLGR